MTWPATLASYTQIASEEAREQKRVKEAAERAELARRKSDQLAMRLTMKRRKVLTTPSPIWYTVAGGWPAGGYPSLWLHRPVAGETHAVGSFSVAR